MIGVGRANILDTYLSPEQYTGTDIRYLSHTTREKEDSRLSHLIVHEGNFSYAQNRAKNVREMYAMYHFEYGRYYNWHFLQGRLNLKAGGMVNVHAGTLYNPRNSNNPAQAKAAISIAPSAIVSYRFDIAGKPLSARYEVCAPLLGLMFSPNYGQSYYEIFARGNYERNVVVTHPVNAPSLRHMLTADFSLWKTTFRMGYLGDYRQAKVNNLKYHTYSHALVIGVVKKFKLTHIRP